MRVQEAISEVILVIKNFFLVEVSHPEDLKVEEEVWLTNCESLWYLLCTWTRAELLNTQQKCSENCEHEDGTRPILVENLNTSDHFRHQLKKSVVTAHV